ncbi:MAG: flagellar hook protein FlgE [Pseudomonadota bacterium]
MGVNTAMFAAITGLSAMGNAMSVISNNIANVNTIGFKGSRSNFQDLLSQSVTMSTGSGQVGRGVTLGAVTQIFSQGAFQNSAQDTDCAIAGEGYFVVRDKVTSEEFYTRAGNFMFDKEGRLVNPSGNVLQGWQLDAEGNRIGTPTDVTMYQFNAPPKTTTQAEFVCNLDSTSESRTNGVPLSQVWDGANVEKPIRGEAYTYQTSIKVYDDLGNGHDLAVYFDPDDAVANKWDYMVCCDPTEDKRALTADTQFAGLLMRGTVTFDPEGGETYSGGSIREITADSLTGNNANNIGPITVASKPADVGIAVTTGANYNGNQNKTFQVTTTTTGDIKYGPPYPVIHWDDGFGASGDVTLDDGFGTYAINEGVEITLTDLNAGGGTDYQFDSGVDAFNVPATANWTSARPNTDGYFNFDASFLQDPDTGASIMQNLEINLGAKNTAWGTPTSEWVLDTESTTQYAAPSTTLFQTQDGFASGYLQSVSIDPDGILTGSYSNGRVQPVFQIGLALFRNQWGLDKIGNNLYSETRLSGNPTTNPPGTGGVGTLTANALEQSNVDLADEFVDMIIQQRGFQANSKVITTTDSMMAELINMKR